KPQPGFDQTSRRPFGSTFKHNLARSQIQIQRSQDGALKLLQNKANFSALAAPIYLKPTFTEQEVKYEFVDSGDQIAARFEVGAIDRVAGALTRHEDNGVTPAELAAELGLNDKTIRNHLTELRRQGRAELMGEGKWKPLPDSRSDMG